MLGFQDVVAGVAGGGDGELDVGRVAEGAHEGGDAGEKSAAGEEGGLECGLLGGVFFAGAGQLSPGVEDFVGLEKK